MKWSHKRGGKPAEDDSPKNISVFLTSMSRPSDDPISFSGYLYYVAYKLDQIKKDENFEMDRQVNLSDFIPEPRSLIQILRMTLFIKD